MTGDPKFRFKVINGGAAIGIKGYGDFSSQDGHGWPIIIDFVDGVPVLYVWPNINYQEPIRISLIDAHEDKREDRNE